MHGLHTQSDDLFELAKRENTREPAAAAAASATMRRQKNTARSSVVRVLHMILIYMKAYLSHSFWTSLYLRGFSICAEEHCRSCFGSRFLSLWLSLSIDHDLIGSFYIANRPSSGQYIIRIAAWLYMVKRVRVLGMARFDYIAIR